VLGEFFRCTWDIEDTAPPIKVSSTSTSGTDTSNTPVSSNASANTSSTTLPPASGKPAKVLYLTEQTSHHPPVSAFWVECPEKGIYARGYDQLSAKFTGTSIKVVPGNHNLGIYITLTKRDNELYQMTHPAAFLGGLLRGTSLQMRPFHFSTRPLQHPE
jgi:oxysterol-binding protein-related protein 9/10/11